MANEVVRWNIIDTYYGLNAPSQSNRTDFYPGRKENIADDHIYYEANIPVGNPRLEENGPVKMLRQRNTKLGRNIICDQEIASPEVTGSKTRTIDNDKIWGTEVDPSHTIQLTNISHVNDRREVETGNNVIQN